MSKPDGSEYWDGVQQHFRRRGSAADPFVHIPRNLAICGHYHVVETSDWRAVTCHACKRLLTEPIKLAMEKREAAKNKRKQKRKQAKDRRRAEKQSLKYVGPCPACGSRMVLRTNQWTRVQFWGCASFPSCRTTAPTEKL